METITISNQKFKIVARIHSTKENCFSWTIEATSSSMLERISHLDFIGLRKEYDRVGYTGELLVGLKNGYLDEYPCAIILKDQDFFETIEAKKEFLNKVNNSKILEMVKRK
ncbi:hypothetical protein AVV36_gp063 [Pectobacterium bacteriophage PM2]|uniref:Uncharacterized protein n=1 Tax=Pectobacterium bacteriophage PM2 TaxID=1429794 RepID=A0A0A0Q2D9_9CAUD|nr:hypothetical protein AVV36_gp063 [Pectobacterium bacteriophage PM2]AHY25025.1 hypothetical protein PM2_063 [Pectobacterium bacteriophage PM2]